MQRLEFKKDAIFLPYLAGYFDARGSFIVDKYNNIIMNFYGDEKFLEELNSLFSVGTVTLMPSASWKIMNNDIPVILDQLISYIIIKKDQALQVNNTIKDKEFCFVIKEPPEDINFFDYVKEEWFYLYLVGYFDGSSRWNLKKYKKSNEYYLQISLISKYEELVVLLSEVFNSGYIIPYNDKFKFIVMFQDSLRLIDELEPLLINKRSELEMALKFKKLLYLGKYEEIEKLMDEFKSEKQNLSNNTTRIINVCEKLFRKVQSKIKYLEISKSKFCQEAIYYSYDNLDLFKSTEDLCEGKKKEFQIAVNINNHVEEKINALSNFDESKSSAIRRAITFYLNDLDSENDDNKLNKDIDPFDLLDQLKKQ